MKEAKNVDFCAFAFKHNFSWRLNIHAKRPRIKYYIARHMKHNNKREAMSVPACAQQHSHKHHIQFCFSAERRREEEKSFAAAAAVVVYAQTEFH
jgi:hypothetical protein